jgi:hypothetical protein
MNQQIAQLQDSDPEFARTLKRLRAASYGLAAAIVLAAALGLWAVVVNSEQATQITKIQKTPCTLAAAGKACTTIKERIARHGSLKNPCIEHQRVTGAKGRNCPQFYVSPSQRQPQESANRVQTSDQTQPGGPHSGPVRTAEPGGKVETHHGASGGTKEPPKSQGPHHKAEPEPAPTDTGTDTAAAEGATTESATSSPASSTSEASPGLIGNPGGAVGKAACDATEVVNELAGVRVCSK